MESTDLLPEAYKVRRNELIAKWEKTRVALETAKANEIELRKEIVEFCFDPEKDSGTETIDLENGYKLKSVKKLNYSVNQTAVNAALDAIENIGGAEGKVIAERLIKWKADLSVTEYKALPDKYRKIIDEAVTTSEGSPTLEIVSPKNTKKM